MSRDRKPVAYVPDLPNPKSPGQTPASLAIDLHYANQLILERWDWDRFTRLCQFLNLTPYELASLTMLPHRYIEGFRGQNSLPMKAEMARPIAMLLTLVEAHVCGHLTKDVIENPFPKL